jgi:hypothetical protein
VEFKGSLFISVLRKRETLDKKWEFKTNEFSRIPNFSKPFPNSDTGSNVVHAKTMVDKMVRRRDLPWVHCFNTFYRGRFNRDTMVMSIERRK